jgi:hypothetical protein
MAFCDLERWTKTGLNHEDGETARLLVYVSSGVSGGEETHESFLANLARPLFRLGLHYPEGSLRIFVGNELFHKAVELGILVLPVLGREERKESGGFR